MQLRIEPGPWAPRHLVGFDLRRRPHLEADVLVIGGGVAGLCAALAAAAEGRAPQNPILPTTLTWRS